MQWIGTVFLEQSSVRTKRASAQSHGTGLSHLQSYEVSTAVHHNKSHILNWLRLDKSVRSLSTQAHISWIPRDCFCCDSVCARISTLVCSSAPFKNKAANLMLHLRLQSVKAQQLSGNSTFHSARTINVQCSELVLVSLILQLLSLPAHHSSGAQLPASQPVAWPHQMHSQQAHGVVEKTSFGPNASGTLVCKDDFPACFSTRHAGGWLNEIVC